MNMKRASSRDPTFNFIKSTIDNATQVFKTLEKDQEAVSARISFWNSVFPDNQYSNETSARQVLMDIFKRHVINAVPAQRFCFELATLLIDMPAEFHKIVSLLPYPYVTALNIAFRTVNQCLEKPSNDSLQMFVEKVVDQLPQVKFTQLYTQILALKAESLNIDRIVNKIESILSTELFDMFLQVLPPHLGLHYALKYGRPYPKLIINFEQIQMPLDFIQAVTDIEGKDVGLTVVPWSDENVNLIEPHP